MSEILGALFGMLIGLIGMSYMSSNVLVQLHLQKNIATAQQQQDWVQGVSTYVTTNMTTLESTATATTPVVINLATLQAAGVTLATGFNGLNPYNQTWIAEVKQPTAGNLQVLVYTTGGITISDQDLGAIARSAAGVGGMIPSNNSGAYPGGAANAYGNAGSWQIATANYTNITGGRPASLLNFSNGNLSSNYLYRNAVPGQPQLNTMNTALNMGSNNITAANQISTQSLQALASGTKTTPSVTLANGTVVAFNQVGEGGVLGLVGSNGAAVYVESLNGTFRLVNSPWNMQLFSVDQSGNVTATGSVNVGGNAGVGGSLTVNGNAVVGSNLQVNGSATAGSMRSNSTITAAGRVSTSEYLLPSGGATENTGCDTNGLVARSSDGTGASMNCQNGVWKRLGGLNRNYVFIGTFLQSTYTGSNSTGHEIEVAISTMAGGSCGTNDYGTNIFVNNLLVATNQDFNPDFAKVQTVVVPVPIGGFYQVVPNRFQCLVQNQIWEFK